MKQLLILLSLFILSSCIPLRIAPKIKDHKIMVAKKFKRNLPRDHAFVFEDPKDANEFYNYINTKYALNHQDVEWNVPFTIDNEKFFFSFYETEIPTKTINLVPIILNAKAEQNGNEPWLEGFEFSRKGNWYLALTVSDSNMKDCLNPKYKSREKILNFLQDLKIEYLNTNNYLEAWFRE
ncbi:MAG: hypothetical protein L3J20_02695 [Flavobacteriaceae bacterium]|nr:hypothetical protein [Flavobacteriaceae bacterium]